MKEIEKSAQAQINPKLYNHKQKIKQQHLEYTVSLLLRYYIFVL